MKKNRYLYIILAVLLVTLFTLLIISLFSQNKNPGIIGGQKDEGGCLVAAGYSWCEPKQKCLRIWEEDCNYELDEREIDALKQMFIDKYGQSADEIEITVNQREDNFIKGGVRLSMNGQFNTGGIFLAYKEDKVWKLAFDGNGLYNCQEMKQYNFPKEFILECISDNADTKNKTELANPASVFCIEEGGILEIRENSDGSQHGVCVFPNGKECGEWSLYRGECQP